MAILEAIGAAIGIYKLLKGSPKSGPSYSEISEEQKEKQQTEERSSIAQNYEEFLRRNHPGIYAKRSAGYKGEKTGWNPDTQRLIARVDWAQKPTHEPYDAMESEAERQAKELDYGKEAAPETASAFDYGKWQPEGDERVDKPKLITPQS